MVFNSYEFILFFLPLVVMLYFIFGKLCRHSMPILVLSIASFIFYFISEKIVGLFLVGSILVNYFFYCILRRKKFSKAVVSFAVLINLAFLLYFKYYNFTITSINYFLHSELHIKEIIVPLGISFITFQQIAFLIDTYQDKTLKYKFTEYVLFIHFFPHVSSGPIITHEQFFPHLEENSTFKINWDNIAAGLYMFIMGLGKKVLIADVLGKAVDWGYSNLSQLNSVSAVFIMFSYTFQIYFDFSGYSDMAMGLGKIFNIELPVNFNSPYKAASIREFWDRWHMTLTNFFTRYLYIPLGGSRKGIYRTMLNTMIVFICSGIWHGASWTFILWGGGTWNFYGMLKNIQPSF